MEFVILQGILSAVSHSHVETTLCILIYTHYILY